MRDPGTRLEVTEAEAKRRVLASRVAYPLLDSLDAGIPFWPVVALVCIHGGQLNSSSIVWARGMQSILAALRLADHLFRAKQSLESGFQMMLKTNRDDRSGRFGAEITVTATTTTVSLASLLELTFCLVVDYR
ncbi:hypothetical protein RRG08_011072 [Elysia crispata]|uniref:Uncharacterized protein n=1 Tax=Elysia crispata TaxID=231223 RepID=A0AAE1DCJ8_9GAST|nr:hypothetical protein RRG08_011072 [Elysia crispata]